MSQRSMVDPDWHPPAGVWVQPFDGWGYAENIDGELASQFEIEVDDDHADFGGIRGWRGRVASSRHKYAGMTIEMTPRHTEWTGIIVADVRRGDAPIFSGMAETSGLDCDWL